MFTRIIHICTYSALAHTWSHVNTCATIHWPSTRWIVTSTQATLDSCWVSTGKKWRRIDVSEHLERLRLTTLPCIHIRSLVAIIACRANQHTDTHMHTLAARQTECVAVAYDFNTHCAHKHTSSATYQRDRAIVLCICWLHNKHNGLVRSSRKVTKFLTIETGFCAGECTRRAAFDSHNTFGDRFRVGQLCADNCIRCT